MKKPRFATLIISCLIGLHCLTLGAATIDESARMLAGLPPAPKPSTAPLEDAAYAQYARTMNESWRRYENRVYLPIKNWFKGELSQFNALVAFYPFSGPDFPTLNAVYPNAGRYIMVAIQSAGKPLYVDELSAADSQRLRAQISKASEKFGHIGFFLTNDLDENAARKGINLSPTLMLMLFASRLGFTIDSIQPLKIASDGYDVQVNSDDAPAWHSVRFEMRKDGRKVTLDYLRIDLSDSNLLKTESQRKFIEKHAKSPTFLKAASHLPQNGGFTIIRNAIVNSAPIVVQDETGIDYSLLANNFSVQLYGGFTHPHHLFNKSHQKSLAEAYAKSKNTRPLPFIVGYNKQSGASLQIALRTAQKNETTRQPEKLLVADAKTETAEIPVSVFTPTAVVSSKSTLAQAKPQTTILDTTAEPFIILLPERTLFLSYNNHDTAHATYLSKASEIFLKQLAKNSANFRKNQRVIMTIKIEKTGNIRSVELDRSSGNAQLDKYSISVVKNLKSLPRFPESLAEATDVLGIVLSFPGK